MESAMAALGKILENLEFCEQCKQQASNAQGYIKIDVVDKDGGMDVLFEADGEFDVFELISLKGCISELIDDMIVDEFARRFNK